MASNSTLQCIPANPDITGIGVRIAIYAQNLLTFVPVLMTLSDGYVSKDELKSIEEQSVAILIIAFAILISTVIQATTSADGLSNYHASLILNLSWMNNTCTFIWFLLYIHHKTKPTSLIKPTWAAWVRALTLRPQLMEEQVSAMEKGEVQRSEQVTTMGGNQTERNEPNIEKVEKGVLGPKKIRITDKVQRILRPIAENLVLILGSLHLSLMSAVGLWLWSNPSSFGNSKLHPQCDIHIVIMLRSVPLHSSALRTWSIFIYSILLVPGVNLILPFLFFISPHILSNKWPNLCKILAIICIGPLLVVALPVHYCLGCFCGSWTSWVQNKIEITLERLNDFFDEDTFGSRFGMLCLLLINVIFVADIETSIQRNIPLQGTGEQDWGYGQVLSLILLVVPLRDVLYSLAFVERRDCKVLEGFLQQAAVSDSYCPDDIKEYILKGADPNSSLDSQHDCFPIMFGTTNSLTR